MYPELIALTSAAAFGATAVILKKGLKYSKPHVSMLYVLLVNVIIYWSLALIFSPKSIFSSLGLLYFIVGGIIGNALARSLQYTGISRIGAVRNHAALGSMPIFAAFFSVLFLGESWTFPLIFGTVLIVLGIAILSEEKSKKKWKKHHLIYPLSAAVLYGLASVIKKYGLDFGTSPLLAAAFATTGAFFGIVIYSVYRGRLHFNAGKATHFFIAAGVMNSIALLLNFSALSIGRVNVVMPLIGTQSLFAVLWSFIFLRSSESFSKYSLAAALLVVLGAGIVTAF